MKIASQQIKQALVFLHDRCDGTVTNDGLGFSKPDSTFGKSLAKKILAGIELSPKQLQVARQMLSKYEKSQLNSNGYTLPSFEELELELLPKSFNNFNCNKKVEINNDLIEVHFDFNNSILEAVKKIRPKGTFNSDNKYWSFPLKSLIDIVNRLLPFGFEMSESVLEHIQILKEEKRLLEEEANVRLQWCLDFLEKESKTWKFTPFKHQWQAVDFFIKQINLRCLIADEQGLGKTKSALMCVTALKEWYKHQDGKNVSIIVVCPVSLKMNWIKEAGELNQEIEVYSYAKIPAPPASTQFILITDEAHAFQNIQSSRTKKFLELSESENCLGFICLTGTPMKNGRPSNLFPLLKGIQHPIATNKKYYDKHFCDAHRTTFTKWDVSGAINLEELNREISDKLLRRTKNECLDLPPKIFSSIHCENDENAEIEYESSLQILKEDYKKRVAEGKVSRIATAIVFLGYFRRLASIYKSYQTIKVVEDLLEQNQSVVVFTDFLESADRIANHFNVPALTGQTPQIITVDNQKIYPRQQMVDNFQFGKTKVFVGTIKAGGVGITLTRSSYLIMNDRPWTPGDYAQATDRIHRIGQSGTCNIYDIYGKDIDYVMAALLNEKQENIDKVLKKIKIDISKKHDTDFYENLVKQLIAVK